MNPRNDQPTARVLSDVSLWHAALRAVCSEASNALNNPPHNNAPEGHDVGDEDPNAWS